MTDPVNVAISSVAIFISAISAWFTFVRRGRVLMTQPTVIFFGLDGGRPPTRGPKAKVFLRTLLYSPAKRGALVESMYVTLTVRGKSQNFNVWVYGDGERLLRGSGLFVPESGFATNHHFLLPEDVEGFDFIAGAYRIELFARIVGERKARSLFTQHLDITPKLAEDLANYAGIYFDWAADSASYLPHVEHPVAGMDADAMSTITQLVAMFGETRPRDLDRGRGATDSARVRSPRV